MTADRRTLLMEAADHVLASAFWERQAERVFIADLGELGDWIATLRAATTTLRYASDRFTVEAFIAGRETAYARGEGECIESAFEALLRDVASRRREDAEVCKARASHAA